MKRWGHGAEIAVLSERASVSRRAGLSGIGAAWQGAVRFLTNALVGHIAGPAALGTVATALSTVQVFTLLWPASAGSAASKYVARSRGAHDPVELAQVATHLRRRVLQSVLVLGSGACIFWWLFEEGPLGDVLCVAVLFAGIAGYSFTRGAMFGAGLVRRAVATDLVTGLCGLAGVALTLIAGGRGVSILLPLGAAYLAFTYVNWPKTERKRPGKELRRELDLFVLLGTFGTLSSSGFIQGSMIVAHETSGARQAGYYAAAFTLATPTALLANSLSLALFPSIAEALGRRDLKSVVDQTDRATRYLVTMMTAIIGVIVINSDLLISTIWGAPFAPSATLLPPLLIATLATSVSVAAVNSITAQSQRGMAQSALSSATGLVVGAAVWLVLANSYGVTGIALGYLAGSIVIGGLPIAIAWRRDGQHWAGLFVRMFGGVCVATSLWVLVHKYPDAIVLDVLASAVFLAFWALLMRRETTELWRRFAPASRK